MVFVANKPVGNVTAFDIPLVCNTCYYFCAPFFVLVLLPCLINFLFFVKLKEVAMHLMTSLKINTNSVTHELGQWA